MIHVHHVICYQIILKLKNVRNVKQIIIFKVKLKIVFNLLKDIIWMRSQKNYYHVTPYVQHAQGLKLIQLI